MMKHLKPLYLETFRNTNYALTMVWRAKWFELLSKWKWQFSGTEFVFYGQAGKWYQDRWLSIPVTKKTASHLDKAYRLLANPKKMTRIV